MATTASDLIDSISRRVRDASNTAHTRAFVRDLLDRSQVIVNAHREYIVSTINLVTQPGKSLYAVGSDITGLQRVTAIDDASGRLDEIRPWRNLWKLSPTWHTDAGPILGWAMIGKTTLALYPVPSVPVTLQLRGPAITTKLNADAVPMDLRNEDADIVRDIVTSLLLFRQRDLDMVTPLVLRTVDKLNLSRVAVQEEQRDGEP